MRDPMIQGSAEYLDVGVKCDVVLDSQPVAFSLDHGATWQAATWQGSAGTSRTASLLLDGTLPVGRYRVLVQITDSPEIPIIDAGYLAITPP